MANSRLVQYRLAEKHLSAVHPVLAQLIERVGPCTMQQRKNLFEALIGTVISQQISTKAAKSMADKLRALFDTLPIMPAAMLKIRDRQLRACGLSRAKRKTIVNLARLIDKGELDLRKLKQADDETVSAMLLPIHGIGPWSVDMILLFSLGRMDVLPVGDFGFRAAVRDEFGLTKLPSPSELETMSEPWRPYRSIATWYSWRSRGPVPQSK